MRRHENSPMRRIVGPRCTICNHPARPQIDLAIATGAAKRAIAALSGRLHENLALVAKLTGELVPHAGTSITTILLSPDFQRLRAELIRVLARYPEAQAQVAAVFRQAGLRAATEMAASPEKLIEAVPVETEHA